MVIGMANWIQLPTRRSNSTYEAAVIVSRHTRHMVRWCARLAALPHITRRPQNYGSEFNPRCEKRSRNGPRGMLSEVFGRNQPELRTSLWGTPWNWLGLAGLGVAAAIILAAIITLNLVPRLQRPGAD